MADIKGFWKDAPDEIVPVEETWNKFIKSSSQGNRVDEFLSDSPSFNNADYIFKTDNIIIELKEITEDFMNSASFFRKFNVLISKVIEENPDWQPSMFGGNGNMPDWFPLEFIKISRKPLDGILKKANKQLRETKQYFNIENNTGVLIIVNDGFTSLQHDYIRAIISDLLVYSYSSIDCVVYTTLNRYVELKYTPTPSLLWIPLYSEKSDDNLVEFINRLGREWINFLEKELGTFTYRDESDNGRMIESAKSIILPDETDKKIFWG